MKEEFKKKDVMPEEKIKILSEIYKDEEFEEPSPIFGLIFWFIVLLFKIYYKNTVAITISIICIIDFSLLIFKK